MVVASFPTEAAAAAYRDALRVAFHVEGRAVSTAIIGSYGQPFDGHQLVTAWVRRELEAAVTTQAETCGGLLHDVSGAVLVPDWVRESIAGREH